MPRPKTHYLPTKTQQVWNNIFGIPQNIFISMKLDREACRPESHLYSACFVEQTIGIWPNHCNCNCCSYWPKQKLNIGLKVENWERKCGMKRVKWKRQTKIKPNYGLEVFHKYPESAKKSQGLRQFGAMPFSALLVAISLFFFSIKRPSVVFFTQTRSQLNNTPVPFTRWPQP